MLLAVFSFDNGTEQAHVVVMSKLHLLHFLSRRDPYLGFTLFLTLGLIASCFLELSIPSA
jgi:hypothetical protein